MKKSTLFALIALILIFLILQSFGSRVKVYEKRKKYTSQEEVIKDFIKNVNLKWEEKNADGHVVKIIPNLDFYETISERYRLIEEKESRYISIPYFKEYNIQNVSIANEFMLDEHLNTYKKIENYKVPTKREVYRIYGKALLDTGKYSYDEINNETSYIYDSENYEDVDIYLVVVYEGKGYVVDYYIGKYN